jgi:hypothetical protein
MEQYSVQLLANIMAGSRIVRCVFVARNFLETYSFSSFFKDGDQGTLKSEINFVNNTVVRVNGMRKLQVAALIAELGDPIRNTY